MVSRNKMKSKQKDRMLAQSRESADGHWHNSYVGNLNKFHIKDRDIDCDIPRNHSFSISNDILSTTTTTRPFTYPDLLFTLLPRLGPCTAKQLVNFTIILFPDVIQSDDLVSGKENLPNTIKENHTNKNPHDKVTFLQDGFESYENKKRTCHEMSLLQKQHTDSSDKISINYRIPHQTLISNIRQILSKDLRFFKHRINSTKELIWQCTERRKSVFVAQRWDLFQEIKKNILENQNKNLNTVGVSSDKESSNDIKNEKISKLNNDLEFVINGLKEKGSNISDFLVSEIPCVLKSFDNSESTDRLSQEIPLIYLSDNFHSLNRLLSLCHQYHIRDQIIQIVTKRTDKNQFILDYLVEKILEKWKIIEEYEQFRKLDEAHFVRQSYKHTIFQDQSKKSVNPDILGHKNRCELIGTVQKEEKALGISNNDFNFSRCSPSLISEEVHSAYSQFSSFLDILLPLTGHNYHTLQSIIIDHKRECLKRIWEKRGIIKGLMEKPILGIDGRDIWKNQE